MHYFTNQFGLFMYVHFDLLFPLSVGYTIKDLVYQWTSGRGVNIASDMKLSQFDLISTPTGNISTFLNKGKEGRIARRNGRK